MGIGGLWTYCKDNLPSCGQRVDLVQVAKHRGGIILLVDYYSFEFLVIEKLWSIMNRTTDNPYLKYSGGEYHTLNDYVTKFTQDLKSLGIELEFVVDGAQGTSPEVLDTKTPVWKRRYAQYLKDQRHIISMLNGEIEVHNLRCSLQPVLLTMQLLATLKACGCTVHCVSEEADRFIALKLQTDPRAFAVLSNDTDFCVFEGGAMIYSQMFDMCKNIKLMPRTLLPMKPSKLMCQVVSAEKFQNHQQMIEFSIMAGNDTTKPFKKKLNRLLDGPQSIQNVARWVKFYECVENHPKYIQIQAECPSLQVAVETSRAFFTLADVASGEPSHSIAALLSRGMRQGTFHSSLLAMHNGVYWATVNIEQPSLCGKTAEAALTELRKRIYRMVLPEDVVTVTEYGIDQTSQHFTPIRVKYVLRFLLFLTMNPLDAISLLKRTCLLREIVHDDLVPGSDHLYFQVDVDQYRSVPSILSICPEEVQGNLQHFERIITHQEDGSTKSWFERYGRRTGFLCHILRYFLLLNRKHNLLITEDEFCALFAVVFGSSDERWHQGLRLKPSPRCATISTWFQNVYLYAHRLLGGILYLSAEFPTPADIFSGAVWNSFYACRNCEEMPPSAVSRCKNDMDQTASFRENRVILKEIVDDLFG
ncbi:uncharacterized protein LOC124284834 [Haliotis rubra]|uniref:uncharacterized protein LOC124284834 n=1 Tax=Haliotis rubra TaxID=36100 RepID=UPI001EE5D2D9|nr:uncharacterized protein LOC124284834 [Haliotis rubra]